jgi:hypothetical protein
VYREIAARGAVTVVGIAEETPHRCSRRASGTSSSRPCGWRTRSAPARPPPQAWP